MHSRNNSGKWVKFPQGDVGSERAAQTCNGSRTNRWHAICAHLDDRVFKHVRHAWNGDPRNCVGYAISEIPRRQFQFAGQFVDLVKHTPGQAQTATQVSSTDPWHTAADMIPRGYRRDSICFSQVVTRTIYRRWCRCQWCIRIPETRGGTGISEKRGYPISYVEMGEEPDGQFMLPEDYAALYLQFATAMHKVDPKLETGRTGIYGSE